MAFGDAVTAHTDAREADWIAPALGAFGTIGGVVPRGYESYLLIDFRNNGERVGPHEVRRVFAELAVPLAAATSTPDACYFAIWEGYGFGHTATAYARSGHGVDRAEVERSLREAQRADAARLREVTAALSVVPTFELPGRRYYLVAGRVDAVARITRPDGTGPQPPDLWWPSDRRWFVGGDTDLDWCYLGGSQQLTEAVQAKLATRTRPIDPATTNLDAGHIK